MYGFIVAKKKAAQRINEERLCVCLVTGTKNPALELTKAGFSIQYAWFELVAYYNYLNNSDFLPYRLQSVNYYISLFDLRWYFIGEKNERM